MAVKDLVELFEPSTIGTRRLSERLDRKYEREGDIDLHPSPGGSDPPPTPARFITKFPDQKHGPSCHPTASTTTHPVSSQDCTYGYSTTHLDNPHETTLDIVDAQDAQHDGSSLRSRKVPRFLVHDNAEEVRGLLDKSSNPSGSLWNGEAYPLEAVPKGQSAKRLSTASSTLVSPRPYPHVPVPATVVFGRNAAPLHLPKLDNYLASLSPPVFSPQHGQADPRMFPPMDCLAKSERSLDDLEANKTKAPFWRNRKTILGSSLNVILGIMVGQSRYKQLDLMLSYLGL